MRRKEGGNEDNRAMGEEGGRHAGWGGDGNMIGIVDGQ